MRCAQFLTIFLTLLLLATSVLAADIQTAQYATIQGKLSNPIEIIAESPAVKISYLHANLSWFPRDMIGQEVTFFTTNPKAKQEGDSLIFELTNPDAGDYSFDIDYEIRTKAGIQQVDVLVPFPLPPFSNDLLPYMQSTDTIDISNEMTSIASSIASKYDDAYLAIVAIADWTKENIAYNLSTIAVEASQPSSWVLENREGVCDEMTNLFISFMRSLGIPARFVSGLAYTESELFTENWGAHGWAEVYFPGVGWIPFDIAYGQYGWVDASHIIFATGVDSGKYASSFEWLGKDVQVVAKGMQLDANILDTSGAIPSLLEIEVEVLEEEVGIGSYQLIQAELSNPTNEYVVDVINLGLVNDMEILDDPSPLVALAPGTSQLLSWRVLIAADLNKNAYYRYPVNIYSHRGVEVQEEFIVRPRATKLSLSLVDTFAQAKESGELPSSEKLFLDCKPLNEYKPRVGEEVRIQCIVRNTEAISLQNLKICIDERNCEIITLAPSKQTSVTFTKTFENDSIYGISFSAINDKAEQYNYLSLEVVDVPEIIIENVSVPKQIDYSKEDNILFTVRQIKGVPLQDVHIRLDGPRVSSEWDFAQLKGEKVFKVVVEGSSLSQKESTFTLLVQGKDERNQEIILAEDFDIFIGEITWWQRIILGFTELFVQ